MMKTVLITGGTAGIGLAATKLFLQNGWQVMMVARNADKGTAVKTELAAEFGAAIDFCQVDVSDEKALPHCMTSLLNALARSMHWLTMPESWLRVGCMKQVWMIGNGSSRSTCVVPF